MNQFAQDCKTSKWWDWYNAILPLSGMYIISTSLDMPYMSRIKHPCIVQVVSLSEAVWA